MEKGLTQAEITENAGFTRSVVGDYECGAAQRPPLDVAKKFAKAFGLSLDALEQLVAAEEENEAADADRVTMLECKLERVSRELSALVAQVAAISKPYPSRNGARASKT